VEGGIDGGDGHLPIRTLKEMGELLMDGSPVGPFTQLENGSEHVEFK
jgi:hypothetical protein